MVALEESKKKAKRGHRMQRKAVGGGKGMRNAAKRDLRNGAIGGL